MSSNPAPPSVPSTADLSVIWVTYGLFGLAMLTWWPALIGLVLCYLPAGSAAEGFISTHDRWLIRTFWWALLGHVAAIATIIAAAWPLLRDIFVSAGALERGGIRFRLDFAWSSIFSTAGGAAICGLLLLAVWGWFAYRVIRGAARLANARPAP